MYKLKTILFICVPHWHVHFICHRLCHLTCDVHVARHTLFVCPSFRMLGHG